MTKRLTLLLMAILIANGLHTTCFTLPDCSNKDDSEPNLRSHPRGRQQHDQSLEKLKVALGNYLVDSQPRLESELQAMVYPFIMAASPAFETQNYQVHYQFPIQTPRGTKRVDILAIIGEQEKTCLVIELKRTIKQSADEALKQAEQYKKLLKNQQTCQKTCSIAINGSPTTADPTAVILTTKSECDDTLSLKRLKQLENWVYTNVDISFLQFVSLLDKNKRT